MGCAAASLPAAAAFLLTTALSIFTLFFAVAFTIRHSGWYQIGISAAVLDVVDLACLACSLFWAAGKHRSLEGNSRLRRTIFIAVIIAFVASHALTLALLISMQRQPAETSATVFGQHIQVFLQTAWALWAASLVAQLLLIVLWNMRRPRQEMAQHVVYANPPARISDSWGLPSALSLHIFSPPYSSHSTVSTADSGFFTERKGLLQLSPRPTGFGRVSSSTKLTLSPNASERELGPVSSPTSPSDEFVEKSPDRPAAVSEVIQQRPNRPTTPVKQRLEPIPGSQPNSPAKPLDGPFEAQRDTEASNATESGKISPSLSVTITEPERGRNPTRIPPRFRKDGTTSPSKPTSPVIDESHIHPLFRSDSPLPPPNPTLGSTITASAFGGQYMAGRSASRASSRSRQASTDTLTVPSSRRRSGSLGAAFNHGNPQPLVKRTRSLGTVKPKAGAEVGHQNNLSVLSVLSDATSFGTNSVYGAGHQTGIII